MSWSPSETSPSRYSHIDGLFGDNAIDWDLIERHWPDLLRRLGNHSHKNRLYRAFRELGRVIRTVTPLRYIQHTIRRMGDLVLNLSPPEEPPVTRLGLESRVLFASRA